MANSSNCGIDRHNRIKCYRLLSIAPLLVGHCCAVFVASVPTERHLFSNKTMMMGEAVRWLAVEEATEVDKAARRLFVDKRHHPAD